ncbi:hypothetical protein Pmani_023316 [Petrolisthes manimaculis]|uniref:Uncharacterized protein n=1 Tax=Petrolisthes manimaculis TaxID=1843537 RepID=A0AAE1PAB0_9EUCA|nr:hypothetical protein Pmani_023316 [Petrolisthes manimaculis]
MLTNCSVTSFSYLHLFFLTFNFSPPPHPPSPIFRPGVHLVYKEWTASLTHIHPHINFSSSVNTQGTSIPVTMKLAVVCVVLMAGVVAPSLACMDPNNIFVSGLYEVEVGRLSAKLCAGNKMDCLARVSKCSAFMDLKAVITAKTINQALHYFHTCGDENGLDFSAFSQMPSSVTPQQAWQHVTTIFLAIGMDNQTAGPTFYCIHNKLFSIKAFSDCVNQDF